jgi:undecaprenyl-diphosphatase
LIAVVAVVRRPAVWIMVAAAGEGLIYSVLNQALRRPRPSTHLVHVVSYGGGYGYPSGHAAFFLTFGALTVICLCLRRAPDWALVLAALAAAAVLFDACLSRMYEGQHWPSDILGGLLLGGGWACLVLSIRRLSDPVLGR